MELRMITLQRLLSSIAIASLSLTTFAYAEDSCNKEFKVLIRHKKKGYDFVNKTLTDLNCKNTFEGKYFKIVKGITKEAIQFDDNEEIVKKAANVYYHLTVARDYWINEIKSDYVKNLNQITIRLDITNSFSNQRHFKNEGQEQNYNNAWTIPEGRTPRFATEKDEWGKEIWFSPMKKIESKKMVKSEGNNPVHQGLVVLKDPIISWNQGSLTYLILGSLFNPVNRTPENLQSAVRKLVAMGVIIGVTELTKYIDGWFLSKYFYIDTAMVPDIIYHEYSHIALSDTMKPTHSVPVIEGMADYFAALVANRTKLYEKLKDISNNKNKNLENKDFYHPYYEESWNATSDFTVSLLWNGRMEFEKINQKQIDAGKSKFIDYDQLVFNTHFSLNEFSNIATDLTRALLDTCVKDCPSKMIGVSALHSVFEKKGLN